jgi:hypothetical protein
LEAQNEIKEIELKKKKEKDETEALMKKSYSSMQNSFEVFKKLRTQKLIMVERKEQGKQMLEKYEENVKEFYKPKESIDKEAINKEIEKTTKE